MALKTKQPSRQAAKSSKAKEDPALRQVRRGVKEGYRSGLEDVNQQDLAARSIPYEYEAEKVPFMQPAKRRTYTWDFRLPNKIIVETKGRFVTADRQKHLLIQQQWPALDIRFVFSNSRARISKQSKTTYGMWCEKNGFQYADKKIPQEWVDEKPSKANLKTQEEIRKELSKKNGR